MFSGVLIVVISSQGDDYWDIWWNYQPGVSGKNIIEKSRAAAESFAADAASMM